MGMKVYILSIVHWVLSILYFNPSGTSWHHLADFSSSDAVWAMSAVTFVVIGLPFFALSVIGVLFILWNGKKFLVVALLLGMVAFVIAMQVEMKGQGLLNNAVLVYAALVFVIDFAVASAIAFQTPTPAGGGKR